MNKYILPLGIGWIAVCLLVGFSLLQEGPSTIIKIGNKTVGTKSLATPQDKTVNNNGIVETKVTIPGEGDPNTITTQVEIDN